MSVGTPATLIKVRDFLQSKLATAVSLQILFSSLYQPSYQSMLYIVFMSADSKVK
jgi:hypothetical protein